MFEVELLFNQAHFNEPLLCQQKWLEKQTVADLNLVLCMVSSAGTSYCLAAGKEAQKRYAEQH